MSEEIEVVEVDVEDGTVVAEVVAAVEPVAEVRQLNLGWQLVTFGCWSVTVANDGQIHLPQSMSPDSVGDFCAAVSAAAEVAARVIAENKAREAARSNAERRGLRSSGGVIVSDSGVPSGAMRIPVSGFPARAGRSG